MFVKFFLFNWFVLCIVVSYQYIDDDDESDNDDEYLPICLNLFLYFISVDAFKLQFEDKKIYQLLVTVKQISTDASAVSLLTKILEFLNPELALYKTTKYIAKTSTSLYEVSGISGSSLDGDPNSSGYLKMHRGGTSSSLYDISGTSGASNNNNNTPTSCE